MKSLSFTIPLRPKPKGNTHRRTANGGIRNDTATVKHQQALAYMCRQYKQTPLWEGPVYLQITCVFKIPSTGKYKNKKPGQYCIAGRPYGDRGNCMKMIEDALQGILYVDDCQTVDGPPQKKWGTEDCYEITAWEIEE